MAVLKPHKVKLKNGKAVYSVFPEQNKEVHMVMNNTAAKAFGEIMRRSRTGRRIPQERLAEIVGISVTYCREIEHGKYTPTWIIWLKICKLLDIDIDKLYELYVLEETDKPA